MIQGTAKQLIARGVKVNGFHVDAVALGQMLKFKIISTAGTVDKPVGQRGKAATIYVLRERPDFEITVSA